MKKVTFICFHVVTFILTVSALEQNINPRIKHINHHKKEKKSDEAIWGEKTSCSFGLSAPVFDKYSQWLNSIALYNTIRWGNGKRSLDYEYIYINMSSSYCSQTFVGAIPG